MSKTKHPRPSRYELTQTQWERSRQPQLRQWRADRQQHCPDARTGGDRKRGAAHPALGRSRGGLSTKIHMATDGQGRAVRFILTGGQRNDITQAPALLAGFKPKYVLADKGYDSRQLVALIQSLGAQPVIPPRSCQQPRACGKARYRLRNRIERCFARLKQFRRIATRFDRKPSHFLAFLYLAS
ncbi:IS5 family transposase, partial [Comamonadaceae bacterium OH3737_COT-264]